MIRILSLVLAVIVAVSGKDSCFQDLNAHCIPDKGNSEDFDLTRPCTAQYGTFMDHLEEVQDLANLHLQQSFKFLVMASHFNTYKMNREGFYKYYQGLSDTLWEDAINIVKYVSKRGGNMNKKGSLPGLQLQMPENGTDLELSELKSLAMALDMQKVIANKTHDLHKTASRGHHHRDAEGKKKEPNTEVPEATKQTDGDTEGKKKSKQPDAELVEYLERDFVMRHADRIRELSGHFTNLKDIISTTSTPNFGIYLFDQMLK